MTFNGESAGFASRLAVVGEEVTTLLDRLLASTPEADEIQRPPHLLAAMRYAALSEGKRLRPFLLVESARLFAVDPSKAMLAGAAIECVHAYSLVHDDLPAMDDDDLRRGQPTVHKAFDEATAILAGDALLTLAFDILARPQTHPSGEVRADLVAILASAAGVGGMAGGQMLDLTAGTLDEASIGAMQAMKTGALFAAACEMGAALGETSPKARAALRKYGQALGRAFQIADDLLDIEASAEEIGKTTAKDSGHGKATLVGLLGREQARVVLGETVAECVKQLVLLPGDTSVLAAAARFAAERRR